MGGDSPGGNDVQLPVVSEVELDCIRLAGTGANSKIIARKLGLSHNTVNMYASRVRRILGAADRYEAAEMLRRHDAGEHLNKFKLKSEPVEPDRKSVNPKEAIIVEAEVVIGSVLREERAVFDRSMPLDLADQATNVGGWGRDNELTRIQRVWWMVKATLGVIFVTFLAFAAVQSLDTTLTKFGFIN
ncbi:helix-turn-helix transcriptional regulator [Sphingomonas sp.]|jgi:DNA-binding CsgD family transcriptional regulator|uniref:helix-turn-helix domain-containing protein n=1 Tax=Sphingomonas sp. TaxID=28214 RepID=UPI002E11B534|nr:helix-turn-helix transcriptional regulator [Sphingomonas sp.]